MDRPVGRTSSWKPLDLNLALTNLIGALRQTVEADLWTRFAELEALLDFSTGVLLVKDDSNMASVPTRRGTLVNVRRAGRDAGNWVYSVCFVLVLVVNSWRDDFLNFDHRILCYFRDFCVIRPGPDGGRPLKSEALRKVGAMGDLVETILSRVQQPRPPGYYGVWDLRGSDPLSAAVRSLIMLVFTTEDLLSGPLFEVTNPLSTPHEAADVILAACNRLFPMLRDLVLASPELRRGTRDQRGLTSSLLRSAAHAQRAIQHRAAKRSRE